MTSPVDVREESMAVIGEYARVPSAFLVERVLRIREDPAAPSRWTWVEETCAMPFTKDYDAIPGTHPTAWPRTVDTTRWRIFSAHVGERRIGGAILIPPSSVSPTADDTLVTELWDLRVHPDCRRRGVASALWKHVESVVPTPLLRVETQQINVPACTFYSAQGCVLSLVEPSAYPALPGEVRLVWEKSIVQERPTSRTASAKP